MTPGPKPKPTAIRTLENNAGNIPLNHYEPKPANVQSLDLVEWLTDECEYMRMEKFPLRQVSKIIWDTLAPELERLGVLKDIDRNKFGRYCETFARWLKAKAFIDEHGETHAVFGTLYESEPVMKDGEQVIIDGKPQVKAVCKKVLKQMKPFPQVNIYIKLAEQLRKYEEEFGIGAASRTRIQAIVQDPLGRNGNKTDPDHDFDYASRSRLKAVK